LEKLERIADFQTKNQACRRNIDLGDERKTGCKRMRSIVEKADYVAAVIDRSVSSDSRLDFVS